MCSQRKHFRIIIQSQQYVDFTEFNLLATFKKFNSFAQGFYPKSHGILANSLYDSKLGELGYSYDLFHYNESIWPIWVSDYEKAKKEKRK